MTQTGITLFTEIIYGISGISGLLSNFIIVYIILCCLNQKTKNLITTRCILHLALSDLIVVLFIPFLISDLRYKTWPFSNLTCSLLNLALLTTHFTKSFLLVFFGLTTLAIFKGQVLDLNYVKVSLVISMTWFFSFLIAFFLVINGEQRGRCNVFYHSNDYFGYREAFTLMYTILVYLAPVTVLFFLIREKQLNVLLDEQQMKIKQSLNLALIMLFAHFALNTFHIVSQWIFTFHTEYDLSIRGYSIDANRTWKTNLFCISTWFLYALIYILPLIYYRFSRKFGLGFEDFLESLTENGAHLQNYLQELRESNRLGQIYYKPVALYDKMKNNLKNSMQI